MSRGRPLLRVCAVAAGMLVGVACSSATPTRTAAKRTTSTTTPAPILHGYSAYAAVVNDHANVFPTPAPSQPPTLSLAARNENGAPQTLLIREERTVGSALTVWYQVLLPVKPNGSTGWVRAADVHVVGLRYRLVVHLGAFRLDLYDRDTRLRSITIGEGTDQTPTPNGLYYIKELLRPPDQNTIYGHYVFGLSGFSNVLKNWPGGGVLGIHGTNDPDHSLGVKVSHGCIRMRNQDIEYLARLLPLGTPVTVTTN